MSPGAQFGRSTRSPHPVSDSFQHIMSQTTGRAHHLVGRMPTLVRFLWVVGACVVVVALVMLARKHHREKNLLLSTILASLGTFLLVGGGLLVLDPGAPKNEAIKTGGLAGGAIVALYALWLNDRRRKVEEARQELDRDRAEHDRSRVADERFARAVELLGHETAQVRVGAMHALGGLAKSRTEYTQTVLDILCAYLRRPLRTDDDDSTRSDEIELEVRLTSQRLIEDLLPRLEEQNPADLRPQPDQGAPASTWTCRTGTSATSTCGSRSFDESNSFHHMKSSTATST